MAPTSVPAGRDSRRERRGTAWILFFGLAICYFTLHPGTIGGQGYTGEEILSGIRMLKIVDAWRHHQYIPEMYWARHGALPIFFDLPFVAFGQWFVSVEFGVSMQPILLTAAILAVLYLWLRSLATPAVSMLLTLIAAAGTMFWPYAYIGLETKQTFAVLLVGFLGLARPTALTWPRVVALACVSALAISLKSTGLTLAPAVAYVIYARFRPEWRRSLFKIGFVLLTMAVTFEASARWRDLYWIPRGGGFNTLRGFLVTSSVDVLTNAIGIFGSPTKGLFVYAPALLAAIYALPIAFRRHRDLTIFALLVTAGTCAFLCLMRYPADEVWGSRYLHVAMAPLFVMIGAAWPVFDWRRHLSIAALGIIGIPASFLGAFFYYGNLVSVPTVAGQNTMEWMTEDHIWNPILLDVRLFEAWYEGGTTPMPWAPQHVWVWAPPHGDDLTSHVIDLKPFGQPQSFMVRFWRQPLAKTALVIFRLAETALVIGPLLILWAIYRTRRLGTPV